MAMRLISPVTDLKFTEYSFYNTFKLSIVKFVRADLNLICVSPDLSKQIPKIVNYFESFEEARSYGSIS